MSALSASIESVVQRLPASPAAQFGGPDQRLPAADLEFTILMPCLNEARTVGVCVRKARAFIDKHGLSAEVLVVDNGSVDGSQALARAGGARVVHASERGYGAALREGIRSARGEHVIMGDADDSYDFAALEPFVTALRAGHQLVMGNRFRGGIAPGAMPWLHRYLGNPVLSFLGRLFFGSELRDFHCGLRGFHRASMLKLHLVTPGMEFASEMIVKALQAKLRVTEVPTTLAKDGRGRPPHLNTWRDGWRHLRYLLLYSPRWLFLYPGILLTLAGMVQLLASHVFDPTQTRWPLGIHTQLFAMAASVLGYQTLLFAVGAVLARHLALLDHPNPKEQWMRRVAFSAALPLLGGGATLVGVALCATLAWRWGTSHFGALDPEVAMRQIIPGVGLVIVGTQSLLASMYFAALRSAFDSSRRSPGHSTAE
ncbi:MAG: glycosyltransferase family 2 protein [Betaproteobacteria bacterium]|nr:glycosyltransferase family 2 protein [Betaproteobacteria bacterium]